MISYKDFTSWSEYEWNSEGSGRSEKIWLIHPVTNQTGLFKFKKDTNTTDHISECIAYDLAKILEIKCARFELGMYQGREGSFSYNIRKNQDEDLIEGVQYILKKCPQYDVEKFQDEKSGEWYSIEMIKRSIEGEIEFKDFLVIPVFDYLIGNSDRHQSNWAVLRRAEHSELCPLYDNSSSLCAYLSEEQMQGYLGNDKLRWKSLVLSGSRSIIRIDPFSKKRPTHYQMMEYLQSNYYNDTIDIVKRIENRLSDSEIRNIIESYSEHLGAMKTEILIKFLNNKVNDLIMLYS